jgi:hypothetical protein
MKWGASRPYDNKALPLKLGQLNMLMYFEFFSMNNGQQHWGKTDIMALQLGSIQDRDNELEIEKIKIKKAAELKLQKE